MINLPSPVAPDPWLHLRRHTAARIALGRAGASLPTREILRFAHDHALARDAVHAPFDAATLAATLRPLHEPVLLLASAAPDRTTYLQRPDLGRRLSPASAAQLSTLNTQPSALNSQLSTLNPPSSTLNFHPACDLVIIVSDGLSALAAERQAPPLLAALLPRLRDAGFTLGPLCVVAGGRVALQDEIGGILQARLSLMLLGERPGLGTPDSLGAYFTFAPRPGRTDAERNCVSNIRPDGLAPEPAAVTLAALLCASRHRQLSGLGLKEASPPPLRA